MRFLTTSPFIDREAQLHPENSVLEFADDSNVIPSVDWRPMDEKAKERLMAVPALKAAAKKAAEDKKNAIVAPSYEIVEAPVAPPKTREPREAQMTLKAATASMDAPATSRNYGGKRSFDKSPV
jgi:hypothetical protein